MRRRGDSEEEAAERRLLELDDGHELLDSLSLLSAKARAPRSPVPP
jgi:hypothetical protein